MDNDLSGNFQSKDFLQRISLFRKEVKKATGQEISISRSASASFAFASSEQEYIELCGSALGIVIARAISKDDLPIEKAYFLIKGQVEVPLRGIIWEGNDGFFCKGCILTDKMIETNENCFIHYSLWQIPMTLFLDDTAVLMIDFKGDRKAFSVMRGPWNIDKICQEYIQKEQEKSLIVNDDFRQNNFLCKFVEREFGYLFGQ